MKSLTLGWDFNQKLENLTNSLQSLTLGHYFNKNLNVCLALPKLQILKISNNYKGNVPIIFGTSVIFLEYYGINKTINNQARINYDFNEWKNIFYKSIVVLL